MDEHDDGRKGGPEAALAEAVQRAAGAYGDIDRRLGEAGGIVPVVGLYERIRSEIDRLDFAELDRVATEIRSAIERLLEMDAHVRKLNNLKLMIDRERERDADEH